MVMENATMRARSMLRRVAAIAVLGVGLTSVPATTTSAGFDLVGDSPDSVTLADDEATTEYGIDYNAERDEYLVAYLSRFQFGDPSIFAVRLDADGEVIGEPALVAVGIIGAAQTLSQPTGPVVTYNPSTDQYLVSFRRSVSPGVGQPNVVSIRGVRVSATGTIAGSEVVISDDLEGACAPGGHDTAFDASTGGYKLAYNINSGQPCEGLGISSQKSELQSLSGALAIGDRVSVPTVGDGVLNRRVTVTANPLTGDFMVTQEDGQSIGSAHVYRPDLSLVESIPLATDDNGFYLVGDAGADPITGNWMITYSTSFDGGQAPAERDANARVTLAEPDGDVISTTEIPASNQPVGMVGNGDGTFTMLVGGLSGPQIVHLDASANVLSRETLDFVSNRLSNVLVSNGSATDPRVAVVGTSSEPGARAAAVVRSVVGPGALPLVPARILETRQGTGLETIDGEFEGAGKQGAGSLVTLTVTGRAGVPDDAEAVLLNVTAAATEARGFITAYPCDAAERPLTANVNYPANRASSAAAFVKVSAEGTVCLFTSAAAHLIADVNGFVPSGSSIDALTPARLLETRTSPGATTIDGESQGIGRVAAGSTTELVVTGRANVDDDASAVLINVAAVNPSTRAFLTIFPCGSTMPTASNVNAPEGGVVNNLVVAKVGDDGKVCIFASTATELVVDVAGSVPASGGLVSVLPARYLETRALPAITFDGDFQNGGAVAADGVATFDVGGRGAVPERATGVMLNVTGINPDDGGFMTVYPCDEPRPNSSNVNFAAGDVVSNAVFVKLEASQKRVCIFTSARVQIAVDVNGYVLDA